MSSFILSIFKEPSYQVWYKSCKFVPTLYLQRYMKLDNQAFVISNLFLAQLLYQLRHRKSMELNGNYTNNVSVVVHQPKYLTYPLCHVQHSYYINDMYFVHNQCTEQNKCSSYCTKLVIIEIASPLQQMKCQMFPNGCTFVTLWKAIFSSV